MRFLIEPKTIEAEEKLREMLENKEIEFIGSYDPIEKLTGKVEKLGIALSEFKESGVNWQVFKYYLRGRGLSNQIIDNVMGKVEDFFEEMGMDISEKIKGE